MRVTTQHYGQFLINGVKNYTATYFSQIVEGLDLAPSLCLACRVICLLGAAQLTTGKQKARPSPTV